MSQSDAGRREGGLEAPTRHPIEWRSEEFWDEHKLYDELERVYDICHGCRRCVSLCQAFPTLFDLVDESDTMEVDGVAKGDYMQVVDHCYLCDLCYQVKCPYVPPHEWNLDFPHLMLRAKAHKFRQQGAPMHQKVLSSPSSMGRLSTLPVVVQTANKVNRTKAGRALLDKTLHIHPEARVPEFANPPLLKRRSVQDQPAGEATAAGPTRGKVLVFATCYGHYNHPTMVEDMVAVYRHNGIETRVYRGTQCCGMPKMELGDLDAVEKLKQANIPELAAAVDQGWDIVTPIPSCTLMFKQELPLLFPEDEQVAKVRSATFDPFEYLSHRHKAELLKTDFKTDAGKVAYQVACHQRVQNIGPKTREILNLLPGIEMQVHERCSGHDGTYGVRRETHKHSMKIARPVVNKIKKQEADHVVSDCPLAADHLAHGAGMSGGEHPMTLIRTAYGI
ncbi:MAG: heterodisulfide reductase-related iron-sulfur binding cluster [Xanthomonadales bacterium]|nr:heterodisulfide reductase-related iron-sulfur binding cluster [Xanthomonadales bacterium]